MSVIFGSRMTLNDGVERKGWNNGDQWYLVIVSLIEGGKRGFHWKTYVKDFGGHAIADDSDIVVFGCHFG